MYTILNKTQSMLVRKITKILQNCYKNLTKKKINSIIYLFETRRSNFL